MVEENWAGGFFIGTREGHEADQGLFGTSFDVGFFGSGGIGTGFEAGLDIEFGLVNSLSGLAGNVNAQFGFLSVSAVPDLSACNLGREPTYWEFLTRTFLNDPQGSVGFGIGSPVGGSVTVTGSTTTTDLIRGAWRAAGSLF